MTITNHALRRYQSRVAPVSLEQARAALDTPAIRKAIAFGARSIILGTGHKLVVQDGKIVTVLPKSARRQPKVEREQEARNG